MMPGVTGGTVTGYKVVKEAGPHVFRLLRWLWGRQVPKPRRGTYGVAVAIHTENSEHQAQIASDFVETMREVIEGGRLGAKLSLVVIPAERAAGVRNMQDVSALLRKSESTFLIWGKARVRRGRGKAIHVLDLKAAVRHDPVTEEISRRLANEMSELLPLRRQIASDDDLAEFEVNAASAGFAVKYVLAVAAILSGQSAFAQELLEELHEQLRAFRGEMTPDVKRSVLTMRARVPDVLATAHMEQVRAIGERWRKRKDERLLAESLRHLEAAERLSPDRYDIRVSRAFHSFVLDRDLDEVTRALRECRAAGVRDPTWRLSEAFIQAYRGRLAQAMREYRIAFKNECDPTTVMWVEEFIEWFLGEEPGMTQFHFCLGLINLWGKKDGARAVAHFRDFVSSTPDGLFDEERAFASKAIGGTK
jgi:hypothetical protein